MPRHRYAPTSTLSTQSTATMDLRNHTASSSVTSSPYGDQSVPTADHPATSRALWLDALTIDSESAGSGSGGDNGSGLGISARDSVMVLSAAKVMPDSDDFTIRKRGTSMSSAKPQASSSSHDKAAISTDIQANVAHVGPIHCVILVGGPSKGTRFRPLSLDLPKPLFPVAGRPMIYHHVEACARTPSKHQRNGAKYSI